MSILSRDNVALLLLFFFFFNDTATTEIYTLSLHDALPISGPGQAALLQPGVQLGQALEAGHGREEAPARGAHLVLDLPLLPGGVGRAGRRLDEVVRAQLQEAAVEAALPAGEDRVHGRAHVVVDAAPAGAAEEAEGVLVRVEDHLLGLARVGADQEQAAVAEADVGDLDLAVRAGRSEEHTSELQSRQYLVCRLL